MTTMRIQNGGSTGQNIGRGQRRNEHYTGMQRGRHGLLHIIDFCHASFILRLAFEGMRIDGVSGKMHLDSHGH